MLENRKKYYSAGNVIKSVFLIINIIADISSYCSSTHLKQG